MAKNGNGNLKKKKQTYRSLKSYIFFLQMLQSNFLVVISMLDTISLLMHCSKSSMWSSLLIQNRLCTSPYKRKSRGVKSSDLAGHSIVSIGPIHSPEEEMSSYNFDVKTATGILKTKRVLKLIGEDFVGQLFLFKSFSSKINKTRRKNEEIDNTPSTSIDSHSSGSQRLPCTLCPGKSFKDNTTLQIHVNKYHINNALSTFSSTDSITKACGHLAEDKLSSIINNCSREI
jgi:hypothetical protein